MFHAGVQFDAEVYLCLQKVQHFGYMSVFGLPAHILQGIGQPVAQEFRFSQVCGA